ncbi:HlyD family efflux transporter periplasmic adaptor subunit [Streptomyces sp. H10-C2]|uniref:HlyD family efflux transporter periplasmic adaptor subunit n=1 Tax=Streptomyces sp. PH10-H1 TaxID=3046212 RepID=UPI0024B991FE|nr:MULTISPECIES: HlyD family efflux transporter periplasmic adaptor subunit [unclassified Streptomyces]MDJ0347305.1 HlyD family efflux transporter periplasmic adaptor subunit [Streptomyces sp. PH10-H1]MDJ0375539.1 HlyD family efflux transporter periplasmic adaptor subunit [Streptomyces sp. H10-C2]
MQFRQKALSKQQSPEELDVPVRFARPQGGLVLAVTAAVMAVACFWAVTGSVTSKVNMPGLLTHAEGSYILQSPVAGQVNAVFAKEGDLLPKGAPLLSIRNAQKVETVRTVAAGRVTALVAAMGGVVATGADLATVERVDGPDEPLVAVLYAPGSSGSTITVGSAVDLTVQSAPAQQFGVLRGRVLSVGRVPQTRRQISAFLGDSQLGEQFSAQGQPVPVVVQLDRSTSTTSGYTWSSAQGPPYAIDSTTLVSGAIHLTAQRPIDWLLP